MEDILTVMLRVKNNTLFRQLTEENQHLKHKKYQKAQVKTFHFTVLKLCSQLCIQSLFPYFLHISPSLSHHTQTISNYQFESLWAAALPYIILLQRWGPGALTSSTSSSTMNHCTQISLAVSLGEFSTGFRHNLLLDSCPENYSYTVTHIMMQKGHLHQMYCFHIRVNIAV